MATYPVNAPTLSFGVSLKKEYRTLSVTFGDGYTVRTGDGLNTVIEKWSMVWDSILEAERDILIDFFDSLEGFASFDFTAPKESVSKKWIVQSVDETPINATYTRVEAVFERVYDL